MSVSIISVPIDINIDTTGERTVKKSFYIFRNMIDYHCAYHKYWKRVSTLARWTEKAYYAFLCDKNPKTACEMVRCFNALRAAKHFDDVRREKKRMYFYGDPDPIEEALSEDVSFEFLKMAVENAKKMTSGFENSLYDSTMFQDAFEVFECLKKYGGDVMLICKKLSK